MTYRSGAPVRAAARPQARRHAACPQVAALARAGTGELWRDGGMYVVPDRFRHGPFARRDALAAGLSARVLEGVQFVRVQPGVYCHRAHVTTWADRVTAARLALPEGARTTGITRLQELGLDHGPRDVLHFVVEGDRHQVLDGVFLHRTVLMPPCDERGVEAEAAFIASCTRAVVIEAIRVGSRLLNMGRMDAEKLQALLDEQPWRDGARETRWVLPWLDGRCRSMPEAELLTLVRWAGLPEPEVNVTIHLGGTPVTPDQWWTPWELALEYEGAQHQEDRGQYNADIDRYATYRRHHTPYVQVTRERLRSRRSVVRAIHAELVAAGYDGPAPSFDGPWSLLDARLADVVRPPRPGALPRSRQR